MYGFPQKYTEHDAFKKGSVLFPVNGDRGAQRCFDVVHRQELQCVTKFTLSKNMSQTALTLLVKSQLNDASFPFMVTEVTFIATSTKVTFPSINFSW
jgi:hypothetical protein